MLLGIQLPLDRILLALAFGGTAFLQHLQPPRKVRGAVGVTIPDSLFGQREEQIPFRYPERGRRRKALICIALDQAIELSFFA
jgi:hypothetical protein